ncbi:MAG: MCP four helix bundle domain-containing protein [Magnetococcales bacterium]|nr:MCP four helix bundle domain-containing protein [Magnetococcales bacterium]
MLNIDNIKVGSKLIGGFLIVTTILVVGGALGYLNISKMSDKTNDILHAAPLVASAKEMKLAVRSDMQMIMEMLASEDKKGLEEVWKEHEEFVTTFDTFAGAILNGAVTDEGVIYAAKDEKFRSIVDKADGFHNDSLQPKMARIRELMTEKYILNAKLEKIMEAFEKSFDKTIDLSESFEGKVKDRIRAKIAAGASPEEIFKIENGWADMSMEMKTTLAMSRIAIEELAQSLDEKSIVRISKEYQETIVEFDGWVDALLKGAKTDEGTIVAVSVPKLRRMVAKIDHLHNNEFQVLAKKFMDIQKRLAKNDLEMNTMDAKADEIANELMDVLSGVEVGAKEIMKEAAIASNETATSAADSTIIGVFAGFAISLFLGVLLSRNITGPLAKNVADLKRLSEGDLTINCSTSRQDEIGILSNSMADMIEKLRGILGHITSNAQEINSASGELFSISSEMSKGSEVMSSRADNSSENAQNMSGNMHTVSAAAEEMSTNMTNVSAAVEEMSVNMTTISAAAEQANTNLNAVAAASEEASNGLTLVHEAANRSSDNIVSITSSVKDVSVSINDVSEKCKNAAAVAKQASEDSQANIAIIDILTKSTNEISAVVKDIEAIAQQTNMLALNASIEASGAGEAGKGFSVVANEVKDLAKQTAIATSDITKKINEIQNNTQSVTTATVNITDAVKKIAEANDDILHAVDEQSTTIEQINNSMASASEETNEVNRRVDESSTGLDEVNRNMQEIASGIGEVVRNVSEVNGGIQELTRTVSETSNAGGEVASNVANAAELTEDMARAITEIRTMSGGMEEKSAEVETKATTLSGVSKKLDESLSAFTL